MKANKEPEKIYMSPAGVLYKGDKQQCNDIEYTRTDAFMEKARKWFEMQNEWIDLDGTHQCDMGSFEDFRKYMKGE